MSLIPIDIYVDLPTQHSPFCNQKNIYISMQTVVENLGIAGETQQIYSS